MSVLALIIALLPLYQIRLSWLSVPTNLIELGTALVLLGGLLRPSTRRQWRTALTQLPSAVVIVALVFIGAAVISTAVSHEPRVSLGILKGWVIVPLTIGLLVYAYATTPARRARLITVLLATGIVVALLGLSQFGTLPRLQSLYDVPASLALWLLPLTVIALWRGFFLPRQAVWLWLSVPMISALLATQSVTAITALLITLTTGATVWLRGRTRQHLLLSLATGLLIASIFLGATGKIAYLRAPLADPTQSSSLAVRQQLWSVSVELLKEHPLLGIGLGQFEPHYQRILHERYRATEHTNQPLPLPEFVFRDPHNFILSFWLNTGLLGLMSFIYLNSATIAKSFRITGVFARGWRRRGPPPAGPTGPPGGGAAATGPVEIKSQNVRHETRINQQALTLALLSLLVAGLAETTYWKNDLAALHWILIALLLRLTAGSGNRRHLDSKATTVPPKGFAGER